MGELISIVVPVYNAELFLNKCLDSILSQTYGNIEVICVDDESSDGSLKILKDYSERDSRVKVFSKKNEGVSIARNFGIRNSTGDYFMFVDSDDWIESDTCKVAVEEMKKQDADIVMWPYIREQGDAGLKKTIFPESAVFSEKSEIVQLQRRFAGPSGEEINRPENMDSLCTVWGKLYKREVIDGVEFDDIRSIGSYEDGLFNLNVFGKAKKVSYINNYLHHYRWNNNSITHKYNPNLVSQRKNVYKLISDYINNLGDESFLLALDNRKCLDMLGLGINIMTKDCGAKGRMKELSEVINDDDYKMFFLKQSSSHNL